MSQLYGADFLIVRFVDPHDYAIEIELSDYDMRRLVEYVNSQILFDIEGKASPNRPIRTRITDWFIGGDAKRPAADNQVKMSLMCLKDREPCAEHLIHPETAKRDFFVLCFERDDEYAFEILLARSDAERIAEYVEARERLGNAFSENQ